MSSPVLKAFKVYALFKKHGHAILEGILNAGDQAKDLAQCTQKICESRLTVYGTSISPPKSGEFGKRANPGDRAVIDHYGPSDAFLVGYAGGWMTDRTFLVRFKPPELMTQPVVAKHAEIQGEHLVFLNSKGDLAALFLMEVVESWTEVSDRTSNTPRFMP